MMTSVAQNVRRSALSIPGSRRLQLSPWILGLLLSACTVGLDYQTPLETAPERWQSESRDVAPASVDGLTEWWATFDDPLLSDLLARAVASNHDLRIAEARVREARAGRRVASSRHRPQIAGSASATRFQLSENGVGVGSAAARQGQVERTDDFFQAGFDAGWELDLFGGVRRAVEGATARAEAADEDRRAVLLRVVAEVARSYLELRGAEERLRVAEDNLRIQRATHRRVEARVTAGLARQLEVERASAQLAATRSRIPAFQAVIQTRAYRLAVLLGEQPGALSDELLVERPAPDPPARLAAGLPSELLRRRPDVRAAERRLAAATSDVGVAVAELFPRFVLAGAAGRESGSFADLTSAGSGTWSLVPGLRWPIFQGGRIRAGIRAARARGDQALAHYEQTVLLAIEEAEAALEQDARERETRRDLERAAEASRRAVELAEALYQRGLTDYLEVLDAQRTLNDVEDRLVVSSTAVATGLVRLYKALGGGWQAFEPGSGPGSGMEIAAVPPVSAAAMW